MRELMVRKKIEIKTSKGTKVKVTEVLNILSES